MVFEYGRFVGHCARGALLTMILVSTACMTNVSPEQRGQLDQSVALMKKQANALVVDACVFRNALGEDEDYILKQDSAIASNSAASSVAAVLKSSGINLHKVIKPTLCAALSDVENLKTADYLDGPVESITAPIISEGSEGLPLEALKNLYEKAMEPRKGVNASGKGYPISLVMSAADTKQLKQYLEADKVWLLQVQGVDVSTGVTMTQGVLTGLLTALLTGGAAVSTNMSVDGVSYSIAAVDFESGSLQWLKTVSGVASNPALPSTYGSEWAQSVLEPLIKEPALQAGK